MGEYAWVTLATNDSYSLGALVLAHSLKQAQTKHQLAVLVTPGVTSAMRAKLSQVFNTVQEVNILDSKDEANLKLLKRPELGITFTKLHCWRLTQFNKCVFLDADTLVLENCDELFEREELSAAPDVGWPDCFNTGVFVYSPSNETYEKLVQFAVDKGSFDGGDQGLLNLYFSDWAHKDISKHLPFIYNMCSTACYSYLPAFKQFGVNAKIIHFIGATKPWLQYFDTATKIVHPSGESQHLQGLLQRWWDIFCSLIHPNLTPEMTGIAGAFAQLTLGTPRTAEQSALDDHLRRQGWEVGNIDYLGKDSFDNIWTKICETLAEDPLPSAPKPKDPSSPVSSEVQIPEESNDEAKKKAVPVPQSEPLLAPEITAITEAPSVPQEPTPPIAEPIPQQVLSTVLPEQTKPEAPVSEPSLAPAPAPIPFPEVSPKPTPQPASESTPTEVPVPTTPTEISQAAPVADIPKLTGASEIQQSAPVTVSPAQAPESRLLGPAPESEQVAPAAVSLENLEKQQPAAQSPITAPVSDAASPQEIPAVAPVTVSPQETTAVAPVAAPAAVGPQETPVAESPQVAPADEISLVPSVTESQPTPAPAAVSPQETPIAESPQVAPADEISVVPAVTESQPTPTPAAVSPQETPAAESPQTASADKISVVPPVTESEPTPAPAAVSPQEVPPVTESPQGAPAVAPVAEIPQTAPAAESSVVSTATESQPTPGPKSPAVAQVPSAVATKIPKPAATPESPELALESQTPESPLAESALQTCPIAPKSPTEKKTGKKSKEVVPKAEVTEPTPPTTPASPQSKQAKPALTVDTSTPETPPPASSEASGTTPTPPPRKGSGGTKKTTTKTKK